MNVCYEKSYSDLSPYLSTPGSSKINTHDDSACLSQPASSKITSDADSTERLQKTVRDVAAEPNYGKARSHERV